MEYSASPQYVEPYAGGYSGGGHPALEQSGAHVIDQLTGIGAGFTFMLLTLCLSLGINYIQWKANRDLVQQLLNLLPQATAAVQKSVSDFKEALNELAQKD